MSAVDASTEEEIRKQLETIMDYSTTIVITNRIPTIEMCDEVIFIEDGKVKAQGSHVNLKNDVKSYRSLLLENEKV